MNELIGKRCPPYEIMVRDVGITASNVSVNTIYIPYHRFLPVRKKRCYYPVIEPMIMPAASNELHVGAGLDFDTITAAVEAARAGESIIVHPGTYDEDVFINKDVYVIAFEPDAHNSRVKSFRVGNGITTRIEGFEVFNLGYIAAIFVGADTRTEIVNNYITNPEFDLQNSDTFYEGVAIQYNNSESGSQVVISGNTFFHIWSCIYANDYVFANTALIIEGNTFDDIGRVFVASPCAYARFAFNSVRNLHEYELIGILFAGLCIQVRDDSGANIPSMVQAEFNSFEVDTFDSFAYVVARSDPELINNGIGLDLSGNFFDGIPFAMNFFDTGEPDLINQDNRLDLNSGIDRTVALSSFYYRLADEVSRVAVFPRRRLIVFNYQGATGDITLPSKFMFSGIAIGELPEPTREGCAFIGWFNAPCGRIRFTEDTTIGNTLDEDVSNVYMYARWIRRRPCHCAGLDR